MTKRMLVDATHPEETRVAIVESYRDINRLDDLDYGLASRPILKGNIYLAKVMRVEPSLQAAFVEYGGNRHGFLPFSEIHPDYFRIPMADRPADEEADEEGADIQDAGMQQDEQDLVPEEYADEMVSEEDVLEVRSEAAVEAIEEMPPVPPVTAYEEAVVEGPSLPEAFASSSTGDNDVGLITDFGSSTSAVEPAQEPAPVESVGGEVAERFVRQHRPRYKIQEVLKRGQVMLIQVVKEERGNKGAALTTFLSLAGRYCVLMPNTDHGGGVSRKITNHHDRRRMKEILDQLEIPEGMAVILRTAGMEQTPPEIQRDLEYLLRLWDSIREQTLQSTAPSLIYEEANLIKRSVRDLYSHDISEILVSGKEGYERTRDFMRAIMPDQIEKIKQYEDSIPLFFRYHVENQIDDLHSPIVQLRSGGYIVINPTEALVAIDVNSGRATRERHIEETALKTNLEAADEIARQLRLRDLAGLVVIDFIDMEDGRNNAAVERRMKEAMKNDRARLQIGRISAFGLLELSRQRLRPSLLEINFEKCPHCKGLGLVRLIDSASLSVLRAIEEEGIKQSASEIVLHVSTKVALYILNQKRKALGALEQKYGIHVLLHSDDALVPPEYKMEKHKSKDASRHVSGPAVNADKVFAEVERELPPVPQKSDAEQTEAESVDSPQHSEEGSNNKGINRRHFRQNGRSRNPFRRDRHQPYHQTEAQETQQKDNQEEGFQPDASANDKFGETDQQRRRRRGKRGGRRRNGNGDFRNDEKWGRNEQRAEGQFQKQSPEVPVSVFDIDTTPRPVQTQSSSTGREKYENVNPPTEKPKGGWWKRLTGQ